MTVSPWSCCQRLVAEWRLSMWSVVDTNGKTFDVVASFQPMPYALTAIIKLIFLAWATSIWIMDMINYESKGFWYAYLTHWGQLVTMLYFVLSLTTLLLFHVIQEEPLNFITRFTWGIFTTIVTVESVITLLYWSLEYNGDALMYREVMKHGGFLLLLWIDGFAINRIPIRFKQILWPYLFYILYLLWSVIHSVAKLGNPYRNDNDPTTDDDAIYSSVSWNHRPVQIGITCVLLLTVFLPFLFLINWLLSILTYCRFINENVLADAEQV
jgi:hypothetical protein